MLYEIDLRGRGRSSSVPASSVKVTCNRGIRRPNVNLSGYGDNSVHPARRDLLRPSPSTLRNFFVQIAESRVFPSSLSSFPKIVGCALLPTMPPTQASSTILRALAKQSFWQARGLSRTTPILPRSIAITRRSQIAIFRHNHTSSSPPRCGSTSSSSTSTDWAPISTEPSPPPEESPPETPPAKPSYDITFTCTPCSTRSTHRISKQGYHYGSVLIKCPECKNRHVISDHLKMFGGKDNVTIEDLMREKGELVKMGSLAEDGAWEIWGENGEVEKSGFGEEGR